MALCVCSASQLRKHYLLPSAHSATLFLKWVSLVKHVSHRVHWWHADSLSTLENSKKEKKLKHWHPSGQNVEYHCFVKPLKTTFTTIWRGEKNGNWIQIISHVHPKCVGTQRGVWWSRVHMHVQETKVFFRKVKKYIKGTQVIARGNTTKYKEKAENITRSK